MAAVDPRFVVVGEALVDVVLAPSTEPVEAVGGSPANVAVGLARLDVPTLLVTHLGNDDRGRRVVAHLAGSGVELAPGSAQGGRTSTATARLDRDGAADYDFDLAWEPPVLDLPAAPGLHVGSLGTVLQPGRAVVLDLVRQANDLGIPVSYDPNVRPAFLPDPVDGWADVLRIASSCTVVKLSDEDLEQLQPGRPWQSAAEDLGQGERTELVMVTRGRDGAWAATPGGEAEVAAPDVAVVDTVGAGDSFMAGALAALHAAGRLHLGGLRSLDERQLGDLLADAMEVAAVTCARRGANPPRRREVPTPWPRLG